MAVYTWHHVSLSLHWYRTCGKYTWSFGGKYKPEKQEIIGPFSPPPSPAWSHHGVNPVLLVPLCEGDHFYAECEEGPVEKSVHQEHLTWRGEGQDIQ